MIIISDGSLVNASKPGKDSKRQRETARRQTEIAVSLGLCSEYVFYSNICRICRPRRGAAGFYSCLATACSRSFFLAIKKVTICPDRVTIHVTG